MMRHDKNMIVHKSVHFLKKSFKKKSLQTKKKKKAKSINKKACVS